MSSDVGVVVPAFRPDLDALLAYLEAVEDALSPAVLRVELDAPAAGVADAVRGAGVTVNVSARRRGKGAAVTHGFEALDTDVLAFADADGSTDAPSLAAVVGAVRDGADVAVGSRRHPEADVRGHQSTLRRRFGDGFAAVARTALGVDVHDFQCGAKALSRTVWTDVRRHVFESGFAWDFEVLAVATALGYGVREVPVRWEDHPDSTVPPFRTAASFLRALVTVRRRTRALARGDPDGKRRDDRTPLAEEDAVGDE
jgi:glycosyltransferase involved in cell wall biosynthesis